MGDVQRAGAFARVRENARAVADCVQKLGNSCDRDAGGALNQDLARLCWHVERLAAAVEKLAEVCE